MRKASFGYTQPRQHEANCLTTKPQDYMLIENNQRSYLMCSYKVAVFFLKK
jgi:hypothetical protein